jgi:large subunit ribosomal protein L24
MAKYAIRRDDQVQVISGKDKGKVGRVLRVDRDKGKVLVEGVNLARKAMRKRKQEERGGIIDIELPLDISNVMLVTKNGQRTRVGFTVEGDSKKRVSRKTGEQV